MGFALLLERPLQREPERRLEKAKHGAVDHARLVAQEERAIAEVPEFLPTYDELSIAQLRARLRNLDAAQLEELLTYEKAHEARPEFTGMLNGVSAINALY